MGGGDGRWAQPGAAAARPLVRALVPMTPHDARSPMCSLRSLPAHLPLRASVSASPLPFLTARP
jgi:hypothetical protein